LSSPTSGMLSGVRILDVTHFLAGPYATMTLADLGAEVIKLEDPDRPDEARGVGPYFQKGQSLYFAALNSGKLSIALRMGRPEAAEVLGRLVRRADVVVDNYRPGVTRKLGLDHDSLRAINPKIITCSITGYGEFGPRKDLPAYDYTIQALTGVMSMAGESHGPPTKAGVSYVDHSGGLVAALAVCAALVERSRTGVGRHLDVSLYDVQVSMLSYLASWRLNAGYEPTRLDHGAHPSLVPAQIFPVADGWVSVFVGNDAMWRRLTDVVDEPELCDDAFSTNAGRGAGKERLLGTLGRRLASLTMHECEALLMTAGVPCSSVNSLGDALADPQVQARGLTRSMSSDSYGDYVGVTGPLPVHTQPHASAAPMLGEHSRQLLAEVGYDAGQVETLVAGEVVGTTDGS
jgi:crotonobetainyl-CoA:carnitine CoA-transferase CaiB-like acyl-CoA transferase